MGMFTQDTVPIIQQDQSLIFSRARALTVSCSKVELSRSFGDEVFSCSRGFALHAHCPGVREPLALRSCEQFANRSLTSPLSRPELNPSAEEQHKHFSLVPFRKEHDYELA